MDRSPIVRRIVTQHPHDFDGVHRLVGFRARTPGDSSRGTAALCSCGWRSPNCLNGEFANQRWEHHRDGISDEVPSSTDGPRPAGLVVRVVDQEKPALCDSDLHLTPDRRDRT